MSRRSALHDMSDHAEGLEPDSADEIEEALPNGDVPMSQGPPVVQQMGSVLEIGVSPWMKGIASGDGGPPDLDGPHEHGGQLVSVGHTASLFHEVQTVQDKEQRSAARKRARKNKEEEENRLEVWEKENLYRCKWYFVLGCFGLPFLHLVSVLYFRKELRGHDRNFRIKQYLYLSVIVGIIETFIWILWIVVFQLLRDTSLKSVNILNFNYTVGSLV